MFVSLSWCSVYFIYSSQLFDVVYNSDKKYHHSVRKYYDGESTIKISCNKLEVYRDEAWNFESLFIYII